MATPATIYTSKSDRRTINKTLTTIATLTGIQLLDNFDIMKPSIIVDLPAGNTDRLRANYIFIPKFNRCYFIDKITILNNSMIKYECSVDVLETYKTQILALTCTIKRQQNVYNLYLDDPLFQAQNKRQIQTKRIGTGGFSPNVNNGNPCFVLTVAGG